MNLLGNSLFMIYFVISVIADFVLLLPCGWKCVLCPGVLLRLGQGELGKEKTLGKDEDNNENSCRQVESHEDDSI